MSYQQMTQIEESRQQQDLLYHIITNTEATTLNEICEKIKAHTSETYDEKKNVETAQCYFK